MKKISLLFVGVLSITLVSFAVVSPVFASELYRGGPGNGGGGIDIDDPAGFGNRGELGTGIPVEQSINLDGILEDLIHASLADSIDIEIDVLVSRMDAGETFSDIALTLGFDYPEISDMIAAARAEAIAQAVIDGLISQEQVDWMASRGNRMPAENFGDGVCDETGECLKDGVQQNTMMENGYRKGYGK